MQSYDFFTSLSTVGGELAAFVPRLLAALILLFVGWLLAKLVKSLMERFLRVIRFDRLADQSGIESFLRQGEINLSLSQIVSLLVYWLIMLIVIVTVFNSLGLESVAQLFNRIVLYTPQIIAAVLVLVFGSLFARFLSKIMYAYLNNIGVESSRTMSRIAMYAIMVFVFFIALEELQIGEAITQLAFMIMFGAVGLAFAIAFGLGGRDWAASVIAKRMSGPEELELPPSTHPLPPQDKQP
jgi:hypothetical protein